MRSPFTHLVIAGLLVLGAFGGYAYANHALGMASAKSAELLTIIAEKREAKDANRDAALKLSQANMEREAIRNYFVSPTEIVSFLEDLEATGRTLGAEVEVVSVTEKPTPRPHLAIALRIEGSFASVLRSVGAIEYSAHDITVTTLTLDEYKSPEETVASSWTAAMNLTVGMATSTSATTTPTI